jgi:hypothetical protein
MPSCSMRRRVIHTLLLAAVAAALSCLPVSSVGSTLENCSRQPGADLSVLFVASGGWKFLGGSGIHHAWRPPLSMMMRAVNVNTPRAAVRAGCAHCHGCSPLQETALRHPAACCILAGCCHPDHSPQAPKIKPVGSNARQKLMMHWLPSE